MLQISKSENAEVKPNLLKRKCRIMMQAEELEFLKINASMMKILKQRFNSK